jgi:excisionase family DNA binding protein
MKKEDLPLLMTAVEVAEILGVSKRVAYMTMDEKGFPLIRIRRSKYVNREDFFNWLDQRKQVS